MQYARTVLCRPCWSPFANECENCLQGAARAARACRVCSVQILCVMAPEHADAYHFPTLDRRRQAAIPDGSLLARYVVAGCEQIEVDEPDRCALLLPRYR